MKITVRHKDTEIIVSENENNTESTIMRWEDQNKRIQETIILIVEQVKKLNKQQ